MGFIEKMKNISLAVFALIYSSQVQKTNAGILSGFFGSSSTTEEPEEGTIVTEYGDPELGEIIYKPYHKNEFQTIGENIDAELPGD